MQTLILMYHCLLQTKETVHTYFLYIYLFIQLFFYLLIYFSLLANKEPVQIQLFSSPSIVKGNISIILTDAGWEFVVLCQSADRHGSHYTHFTLLLPAYVLAIIFYRMFNNYMREEFFKSSLNYRLHTFLSLIQACVYL